MGLFDDENPRERGVFALVIQLSSDAAPAAGLRSYRDVHVWDGRA